MEKVDCQFCKTGLLELGDRVYKCACGVFYQVVTGYNTAGMIKFMRTIGKNNFKIKTKKIGGDLIIFVKKNN